MPSDNFRWNRLSSDLNSNNLTKLISLAGGYFDKNFFIKVEVVIFTLKILKHSSLKFFVELLLTVSCKHLFLLSIALYIYMKNTITVVLPKITRLLHRYFWFSRLATCQIARFIVNNCYLICMLSQLISIPEDSNQNDKTSILYANCIKRD